MTNTYFYFFLEKKYAQRIFEKNTDITRWSKSRHLDFRFKWRRKNLNKERKKNLIQDFKTPRAILLFLLKKRKKTRIKKRSDILFFSQEILLLINTSLSIHRAWANERARERERENSVRVNEKRIFLQKRDFFLFLKFFLRKKKRMLRKRKIMEFKRNSFTKNGGKRK